MRKQREHTKKMRKKRKKTQLVLAHFALGLLFFSRGARLPFGYYSHIISKTIAEEQWMKNDGTQHKQTHTSDRFMVYDEKSCSVKVQMNGTDALRRI